jgi:uncharacterized protein YnzC (UPF0291/DUF896 family)
MVVLDLTAEEKEILASARQSYLSDLRTEIGSTESKTFRDRLKEEQEVLGRILDSLR